jgi:hypothetical protein
MMSLRTCLLLGAIAAPASQVPRAVRDDKILDRDMRAGAIVSTNDHMSGYASYCEAA